jgi:predicted Abi (CAAX) family protease
MKIIILPPTALGKWAVGLICGFIILMALLYGLIAAGQRGGETFFSNLYLAIPGLLAAVSAAAAFFTGIIGMIFKKERALLVILAAAIGLFVIIFVIGDLIFPQ